MANFKAVIVFWVYKLLALSWRIQIRMSPAAQKIIGLESSEKKQPVVFAHWHGHELALTHLVSKFKLATMASQSKDGALMSYVIQRLGGETVRGSSSRGAVSGLLGLIRLCRKGKMISMAVDGPRGPIYQVKPGVFELARACHAVVIPSAASASRAFVFKKSWNKAFLPLPFSRVSIYFADPMGPFEDAVDVRNIGLRNELTLRLNNASQSARNSIASK